MRIYIAGPMTGLPDYNRLAFHQAARRLAHCGHEPVNPATIPLRDDWGYGDYLRAALQMLLEAAEGVALLPGWYESKGARLEHLVAGTLDMKPMPLEWWVGK